MLTQTSTAARPATSIAVSARRVTRHYGDGESAVHALRGVTLEVPVGQFTAVMGPSGSGKSTLMHLLAGLDRPTNGRVKIGGEDITDMPDKRLTKLRRSFVSWRSAMAEISSPPMETEPEVGRSRPARRCIRVDLPEPEGPMTAVNWPAGTSSETPRRASTADSPAP